MRRLLSAGHVVHTSGPRYFGWKIQWKYVSLEVAEFRRWDDNIKITLTEVDSGNAYCSEVVLHSM